MREAGGIFKKSGLNKGTLMEKRKSPRINKRLEIKFQTATDYTAITNDLSETGLFIRTNKAINPGTIIDLKLNLPNAQELFLTGKIIRNIKALPGIFNPLKSSGLGVQLIDPPDSYISYLNSIRE